MKNSTTRVCFIINPAANRYRAVQHVDWITREAKKRWKHFEVIISPKNQPVSELAREKAASFHVIVACGGDGTVNQVVNGITGTNSILGIIPIGSGNDFIKTLYFDASLMECMEMISNENTILIDLLSCRGDCKTWSINTLGIGLDGWANFHAKRYRRLRGSIIYLLGALKAALSFRGSGMNISIDGKEIHGEFLMITACNGKWEGGGFYIAPEAEPSDGFLQLITIKKMSVPRILSYLPRFLTGFSQSMKAVNVYRCKKVQIQTEVPLAAHCDGEHLGEELQNFEIAVVPEHLRVIIP